MRGNHPIVPIRNVRQLEEDYNEIVQRQHDEGMCLIYGAPGYGKTTAACHLFIKTNGFFIRVMPGWSQKAMLQALLFELGSEIKGTNAEMLSECLRLLSEDPRPLFVDEADNLFRDSRMLETLRSLHDVCGIPIVLIGMNSQQGSAGIDKKIKRYPQFADRISHWIEFLPANWDDLTTLADELCSVQLDEGLLRQVLAQTKGNVRQIVVQLARIQRLAKHHQLKVVDLARWQKHEEEQAERKAKWKKLAGEA